MYGRHKTLDKNMKRSMRWLEKVDGVTKVVLGFSESCMHRYPPGHIRWRQDVAGGIKINGYSGKGVTDIFVKIDPIDKRERVKQLIEEKFISN